MQRVENDCVGCQLACIGSACPYSNVTHFYCDACEEETTLYEYDGRELCIDCIEKLLTIVDGSEY